METSLNGMNKYLNKKQERRLVHIELKKLVAIKRNI